MNTSTKNPSREEVIGSYTPLERFQELIELAQDEHNQRIAEKYRLAREKAARTVAARKMEGLACSVVIPTGYTRDYHSSGRPTVDRRLALLAQEAFTLAVGGMSLTRIIHEASSEHDAKSRLQAI
jgi:hypothetical protein